MRLLTLLSSLLATMAVMVLITTPADAGANYSNHKMTNFTCKSGKMVTNIKYCKENGGKY